MTRKTCQYTILINNWVCKGTPIDNAWKRALIAYVKAEGTTTSKLLKIKNNLLTLSEPKYVQTFNVFALTREEQEQYLKEINTQLREHCLILCDFQYCNEYNLIYNPPPYIIYTIPEKNKPISNCTSKLESTFNPDSNSDNDDDKNNSSSSAQNSNKIYDALNSDSNPKTFITLLDLTKEQELK
ncbi:hypothetical protein G9A89_015540 [Geosiphon pyriformis]|nr:hypothetical protein G9A89_015540 [Geosiphon pyriformis]